MSLSNSALREWHEAFKGRVDDPNELLESVMRLNACIHDALQEGPSLRSVLSPCPCIVAVHVVGAVSNPAYNVWLLPNASETVLSKAARSLSATYTEPFATRIIILAADLFRKFGWSEYKAGSGIACRLALEANRVAVCHAMFGQVISSRRDVFLWDIYEDTPVRNAYYNRARRLCESTSSGLVYAPFSRHLRVLPYDLSKYAATNMQRALTRKLKELRSNAEKRSG